MEKDGMSSQDDRLLELRKRTKITTRSRYRASERLERHHKFSQWTVSLISVALVFIPLVQVFGIPTGIEVLYLNATQATLAVLVLVYSLLLGQENFISRAQAMHRNGIELGRLSRKMAGKNTASDAEYFEFSKEYYDILEKYENHKPVDYLNTLLTEKPNDFWGGVGYLFTWIKAKCTTFIVFSHYIVVMALVSYIFYALFSGLLKQAH